VDVEEEYQRRGVATKLYSRLRRKLLEMGIKTLHGCLEGSGIIQIREAVFGHGNTIYSGFKGDPSPLTVSEAIHRMDVDYGRLVVETKIKRK